MLSLTFSAGEESPPVTLNFEHSLASLSKWESVYKRPFFDKNEKVEVEFRDYIRMMLISDYPGDVGDLLLPEHFAAVRDYISDPHTATTFRDDPNQPPSREVITAEVIYYWMVAFRINWDAQYWHLNNLMALVRICGIKQSKPQKMTRQQQMAEYRRLNEQRRRDLGTNG